MNYFSFTIKHVHDLKPGPQKTFLVGIVIIGNWDVNTDIPNFGFFHNLFIMCTNKQSGQYFIWKIFRFL